MKPTHINSTRALSGVHEPSQIPHTEMMKTLSLMSPDLYCATRDDGLGFRSIPETTTQLNALLGEDM